MAATGRERAARAAELDWLGGVERVVASAEAKAQETATGFLPAAEFEATADAFFASPTTSVRGWEPADVAQRRIVRAVLRWTGAADVATLYVAHGPVGTLLHCALTGQPIDRRHDQPGQGSWYAFDPIAGRPGTPGVGWGSGEGH